MNVASPTKDTSPVVSRTSTQTSLLDHLQSTPKSTSGSGGGGGFLSRRRGDSDGAAKSSTTPLVSFGNGTPLSRPTSSPSSGGGKTATVPL